MSKREVAMREQQWQNFTTDLESENRDVKSRLAQFQQREAETSAFQARRDGNIVEFQLELKEELDRIFHLLSGHVVEVDDQGGDRWIEARDDRLKVFSDYGIKVLMNVIQMILHKGIILSNYQSVDEIKDATHRFMIELADLIYCKYEYFFHFKSPEDLLEEIKTVLEIKLSDDELYWKCVQWSNDELQTKYKHYEMIVIAIGENIYATLLRAWGGKERESLRKYSHFTQTDTVNPQGFNQNKRSMFRPSTW